MTKDDPSTARPRAIERHIRSVYEQMPKSERALADRVLEYPNEVLLHSATELAAIAGASKAAVSRFVKRLGFSDFREMQREFRQAQTTGDPIFLTASPEAGRGTLAAHLENDVACLRQTIEAIDSAAVEEVARRIISARRVVCLGYRNSYFFASYMRRQLVLVRPDVALVPGAGQMLMEEIGALGPDDLLFAFGVRRRAAKLGPAMRMMHERGVPIAYVTDRRAVTTLRHATWAFPCQVRGMSLFDSYVGVISLTNFICTRVHDLVGTEGRARLRMVEEALDQLGELDPDN
ncbi:hypothetical protein LNKW23_42340 [Paralimibaculum aggregatum]|uniref:HTH rpiR-type domain-containing protein n=1 Tax=Paralimibaculum aggregatum TaxID=3036245 RepID=A0ABQ6LSG1_9RHOB|nr:MurR/RpiR family transcriptional regulator [Limibaculum sp. NKW23]GMG85018.1 hypothetical protein LNKW23_42340 [Limibaculum sp. NKW23]